MADFRVSESITQKFVDSDSDAWKYELNYDMEEEREVENKSGADR